MLTSQMGIVTPNRGLHPQNCSCCHSVNKALAVCKKSRDKTSWRSGALLFELYANEPLTLTDRVKHVTSRSQKVGEVMYGEDLDDQW